MDLLRQVGIENFDSYCLKGRLFEREDDFIVQEIEENGEILKVEREEQSKPLTEKNDYITFTLVKRGMSTPEAIKILSRNLHISVKRIAYNGNKDKRALTSQRVSIFKLEAERLSIESERVFIRDIEYSNQPCKIGRLYGNHFTVHIKDFDSNGVEINEIGENLKKGIPNFYGPQRFGSASLNIEVSKSILNNDLKAAFYSLVLKERNESQLNGDKRGELRKVFEGYLSDGIVDREKANELLKFLPGFMYFERESLSYLIEHKNDYAGAIRLMPKYIRLMILQSFQYYIFNRTVSELLKKGEIRRIENIPTIGYDMKLDDSETAGIIRNLMKEEGIEDPEKLKLKSMPEASLKSFMHPAYFVPENFGISIDGKDANIVFDLKKGSYATILLLKLFSENLLYSHGNS